MCLLAWATITGPTKYLEKRGGSHFFVLIQLWNLFAQSYIKTISLLLGHIVVTAVVEKGIGWEEAIAHGCESVLKLNNGILIPGLFRLVKVVLRHAVRVPLHLLKQSVEQLTDPDLIFREVRHHLRTPIRKIPRVRVIEPWSSWWKSIPAAGGYAVGRRRTTPRLSSPSLTCCFGGPPASSEDTALNGLFEISPN